MVWGSACLVSDDAVWKELALERSSPLYYMQSNRRLVMTATSRIRQVRENVRTHRERLRAQGLRPIQIWVPDVRAPSFRRQAHRQSQAVAASTHARRDQAFIDAVSDWDTE
jgi:hypothetical protein